MNKKKTKTGEYAYDKETMDMMLNNKRFTLDDDRFKNKELPELT